MLCQDCQKNDATIHYKEIVNDQYRELHLCEECVSRRGLETGQFSSSPSLANLLAGLAEIDKEVVPEEKIYECEKCHLTYTNFKERGLLGCSHCYQAFEKQLTHMLRKIHGNIQHVGKVTNRAMDRAELKDEIFKLKKELATAVRNEEFEKAAGLRDQIKEMEERQAPKVGTQKTGDR